MSELVQQLMGTSLGAVVSASEAADLVQSARSRSISRGAPLFVAGDAVEALYIILEGSIEVRLGASDESGVVVATLGAGQVVGELEVMTGSLRVANLIATEDSTFLELSAEQFDSMLSSNRPAATKLVTKIAQTLARRLAAVNHRLVTRPANGSEALSEAPAAQTDEPVELNETDVLAVDDEDLSVLDDLWS